MWILREENKNTGHIKDIGVFDYLEVAIQYLKELLWKRIEEAEGYGANWHKYSTEQKIDKRASKAIDEEGKGILNWVGGKSYSFHRVRHIR